MKLRLRVNRQTSRVEILGEDPGVRELVDHIRETVLSSHGLSAETEFSLSLNGSELLSDAGQTLSSCGVVSGDLICLILPQSAAASPASTSTSASASVPSSSSTEHDQQSAAMTSDQSEETPVMSDPGPSVSSWEPMLCSEAEEGQAPLSLELLYHSAQTTSPSDAVMVAVHLLMLETGFIPQGCDLKTTEMPADWRSVGGVYKLHYTHPLCGDSLTMMAVGVSMGHKVAINAILRVDQTASTVHSLCLDPSSYVTHQWPGESAAAAFKDLKNLSRLFKDQLAYPLIAAARDAMKLPVAFGLAALPPELLLRVLRLLDVRSVVTLSSACRHFHGATADSTLWRHLFHRDFSDSDPSRPRDTDWKELYKRFHRTRCSLRLPRHHSLPPFPSNPRGFFTPPPLYPPLPGIIGGEYDQRPALPYSLLPRPRYDPIGPHIGPPFGPPIGPPFGPPIGPPFGPPIGPPMGPPNPPNRRRLTDFTRVRHGARGGFI